MMLYEPVKESILIMLMSAGASVIIIGLMHTCITYLRQLKSTYLYNIQDVS